MIVIEPIFTKFILRQHIFVQNCYREFREYSTNGLVTNTRSDSGRGLHVHRYSS
jgi:hypothetical protein